MLEHSHSSLDSTSFNVTKILITSWYHFPFNRFNKNIFFNSAIISKLLPRVKECLMLGTLTWNPPYFVHPRIPYHCIQITISEAFRRLKSRTKWNRRFSIASDFAFNHFYLRPSTIHEVEATYTLHAFSV